MNIQEILKAAKDADSVEIVYNQGSSCGTTQKALNIHRLLTAARCADWVQIVSNQGPPCFHLEDDGYFCFRAERWDGHLSHKNGLIPCHEYVSLENLLQTITEPVNKNP